MATSVTQSTKPGRAPGSLITGFPVALLATLALAIAGTSLISFQIQKQRLKQEAQERLGRIADRKVQTFASWLRQQRENADALGRNRFFGAAVMRWLASGAPAGAARDRIEQYFSELIAAHHYDAVVLFDRNGEAKAAIGPYVAVSAGNRRDATDALRSERVVVSDFEVEEDPTGSTVWLDHYAPLLAEDSDDIGPVAVVMLRTNSPAFIEPLIQEWPSVSASGEAFLVRRDGDEVVFLTGLRHRQRAPLAPRLPMSTRDLPAALAAKGREGQVEGTDYRGVPVVAALRRIPASPWALVAKVDAGEAYAPMRELALLIAAIAALALLGVGGSVLLWSRIQRAEQVAREARAEAERKALVRHFDYHARYANDIITLTDEQGNFVEVNDRAASESGFARDELLRMNVRDLLPSEDVANYERQASGAKVAGSVFEGLTTRKDGSSYPVEVSARAIDIEGRRFNQFIVRDISERKRAEQTLRESEQKFRAIAASAQDPVILMDHEGKIAYWNHAAERVFGYMEQEAIGRNLHATLAPDRYRDAYAPAIVKFHETGTGAVVGKTVELPARRKDGSEFPVEFSISALQLGGGGWHAVAVLRDIAERKAAEERLRLANAVVESSPAVLFRWRAVEGWPVEYVSNNVRQFNYAAEELLSGAVPYARMVYPEDLERVADEVARYTAGGAERFAQEYRVVTRDGAVRWVDDRTTIKRDAQGAVTHYQGVLTDITERKCAEDELRRSEEKYRTIFEESFDGLFVTSPEGRILDMNRKGVAMFGYDSLAEMQRLDLERDVYAHPPDRKRILAMVNAQGTAEYEVAVKKKNGEEMTTYCALTAVKDANGLIVSYRGIIRDVTASKRTEEKLYRANAVIENSPVVVLRWRAGEGWLFDYVSDNVRQFGYTAEELVSGNEHYSSLIHPEDLARVAAEVSQYSTDDARHFAQEYRLVTREGAVRWVSDLTAIERDAAGKIIHYQGVVMDITERKLAEFALRKVNRALRILSSCNMVLIHATEEIQLLNDICRVIIESEGYRLAWVGYAENDAEKTVRPVAHAGYEPGFMEHTDITWADSVRGRGPVGIAIRTGKIQVVQDVTTDARFEQLRVNAARLGYGSVFVAPMLSGFRTIGTLSIHAEGINAFDDAEIALLSELASDMAFGISSLRVKTAQQRSAEKLERSMEATILATAATVEARDPYTAGHQRRVAELATAIAREMGLPEDQVRGIHLAGVVHDLGKIHIPAEILSKPAKLSKIEYDLIKTHPESGYDILKGVDFPWPIAQMVLQHHERMDGSGYPFGLKGDAILRQARILMVADVVEAMASHRPYRPAIGIDAALGEIGANAGKYYDPEAVRACLKLFLEKGFAFSA